MRTIKGVIKNNIYCPEKDLIGCEFISDGKNYYCKSNINDTEFENKKAEILSNSNIDEDEKINISKIDIDTLPEEAKQKLALALLPEIKKLLQKE